MKLALAALLAAAPTVAAPVFSPERVKADVTFLADDALEGRGTGERGHEIAARYVAAQFALAGLTPAAKDGSFFQRVTLLEYRHGDTAAQVSVTGPRATQSWAHGTEVLVGIGPREAKIDVSAPVVFVGYGIDAPDHGFDDYKGLDVRGKIVAVLAGIPDGPPDEVLAHLATQRAKMAEAHGAIGMVQVATLQSLRIRPWARSLQYANVPRMTWVEANGAPHDLAPGIRASAALNGPAAEALFAGAPVSLDKLRAAAAVRGAHPKGFALKTSVRITASAKFRTITSPEVVASIPGSDPALKGEYVVLMGHLDHLGIRADMTGDNIFNGALDNAAGVAVMLEVARAFAGDAVKPKRSLLFVANTAEEKGLLGAESFANDPSVPIDKIVSVVDLDEPLLLYDFSDINAFGDTHSTLGPIVARAVAAAGVTLSPDPEPEETVFVRSDHYTFVKRGVPAILLSTGHAGGGAAAWADYNKNHYHQPSDDLSQKIDWAAGAKYARINYLIARDIADGVERPRWYAGDYFGATFAPGAPTAVRPDRRP